MCMVRLVLAMVLNKGTWCGGTTMTKMEAKPVCVLAVGGGPSLWEDLAFAARIARPHGVIRLRSQCSH